MTARKSAEREPAAAQHSMALESWRGPPEVERIDAFIEEAAHAFRFLCEQYGFSAPSAEINPASCDRDGHVHEGQRWHRSNPRSSSRGTWR